MAEEMYWNFLWQPSYILIKQHSPASPKNLSQIQEKSTASLMCSPMQKDLKFGKGVTLFPTGLTWNTFRSHHKEHLPGMSKPIQSWCWDLYKALNAPPGGELSRLPRVVKAVYDLERGLSYNSFRTGFSQQLGSVSRPEQGSAWSMYKSLELKLQTNDNDKADAKENKDTNKNKNAEAKNKKSKNKKLKLTYNSFRKELKRLVGAVTRSELMEAWRMYKAGQDLRSLGLRFKVFADAIAAAPAATAA